MQYQIRVSGKVFVGEDIGTLLKRAVEAKRAAKQLAGSYGRVMTGSLNRETGSPSESVSCA